LSDADRRRAIVPEDQAFLGLILEVVAQNAEAMNRMSAELVALRAEVAKMQPASRSILGGTTMSVPLSLTTQAGVATAINHGNLVGDLFTGGVFDTKNLCAINSYDSPHSAPNMQMLLDELTEFVDLEKRSS